MDLDKQLSKSEVLDYLEKNKRLYEEEKKEHEGSSDELYYEGLLDAYGHILTVVRKIKG